MNDDERASSNDLPVQDPVVILLQLLVGGTAEVTDAIVSRLLAPDGSGSSVPGRGSEDDPDRSHAVRARQALIGLLFEAYGTVSRGAATAGRMAATTGRFWGSLLEPVISSRLFARVRLPAEYLIERGAQELDRWATIGRTEEQRSREVARRLMMVPVEDVVAYLRTNPELERLVQAQAQSLLDELADDPHLSSVIRTQGDVYVDHLQENPQAVQELVRGQSAGLAEEVANSVRQRTVSADILLERIVRTVLRRRPRRDLPGPSPEVLDPMNASGVQSLKGHYAGFVSRAVAVAIDLAIVSVVTVVVTWASLSLLEYIEIDVRECPPIETSTGRGAILCLALQWTGIALGVSFPWMYALFFWTVTGQTPGKAVMGVRVVRLDGCPMTLWTSVVRLLGYWGSLASAGLGFLLVLSDNRRQALQDKIASTCVIYSWDAYGDPNLQKLFPRLFG